MDKNIVALVREDAKTVKVKFFPESWERNAKVTDFDMIRELASAQVKEYIYLTTFDLVPGDLAVVYVGMRPTVVEVQSVDADVNIEPNDEKQYKWIVAKVDETAYQKLMEQNEELEDILRKEYQARTRRQFREVFLAGASPESVAKLTEVLSK